MDLEHVIVLQNKIDLIITDTNKCSRQKDDIKKFIKGTTAEEAPIIPCSAQMGYNIDALVDYICRIPIPLRDFTSPPQMIIIRSFDVNKPGEDVENLKGGVAGGTIIKGVLKIGDRISIRPGAITKNQKTGVVKWKEYDSQIISLKADENQLMYAVPGGLIGVGMKIDPDITRSDSLVGQIIGHPDKMPDVLVNIDVTYYLLKRLIGVQNKKKVAEEDGDTETKVNKLKVDELLMINVGSQTLAGKVTKIQSEIAKIEFTKPVCANIGDKIALSRRIGISYRLIGWGEIKKTYAYKTKA